MPANNIQSILEQVAQHSLNVEEAERYVLAKYSASARGPKRTVSLIGLLVFLVVGLFLMYHAWQAYGNQQAAEDHFLQTNGTVSQMVRKTTGRRLWAPIITYQVEGKSYSIESEVSSDPPAYEVGEQVVVQYDPAQPDKGQIQSFWLNQLPALLFGGLGGVFTLISLIGMVSLTRKKTDLSTEILHQTLVQVSMGSISAQEGTQRLLATPSAVAETKSGGWVWRIIIGALLITVVYFSIQKMGTSWRLLTHGVTTSGKVVEMVRKLKGNKSAPIIQYSVDGKVYEVAGKTYSSPAAYSIGEEVEVIYDPESPENGSIQSFSEQWAGPLLGIGLSVCFLLFFLMPQTRVKGQ